MSNRKRKNDLQLDNKFKILTPESIKVALGLAIATGARKSSAEDPKEPCDHDDLNCPYIRDIKPSEPITCEKLGVKDFVYCITHEEPSGCLITKEYKTECPPAQAKTDIADDDKCCSGTSFPGVGDNWDHVYCRACDAPAGGTSCCGLTMGILTDTPNLPPDDPKEP